jgi:hypothetical protein
VSRLLQLWTEELVKKLEKLGKKVKEFFTAMA